MCTTLYFCHGCEENRPEYQFVVENLVAIEAGHAEAQSRLCAYCSMRARTDLDETKMFQCTACNKTKHIRDFSPQDQKEWLHYPRQRGMLRLSLSALRRVVQNGGRQEESEKAATTRGAS